MEELFQQESYTLKFLAIAEDIDDEENDGGRQGNTRLNKAGGAPTTVSMGEQLGIESCKKLDIFWPEKMYKKATSQSISKKEVKGTIRPSEHGCPDGCTEMTSFHTRAAEKSAEMFNSETSRREEAKQEVFHLFRNAAGAEATTAKGGVLPTPLEEVRQGRGRERGW